MALLLSVDTPRLDAITKVLVEYHTENEKSNKKRESEQIEKKFLFNKKKLGSADDVIQESIKPLSLKTDNKRSQFNVVSLFQ